MSQRPGISVLMLTYRHEAFVAEAVASVLAQEVDSHVEVVIADDASPDGTLEAIAALAVPVGFTVRLLTTPHNLGMQANFRRAWAACAGDAVAILEGDDFWTHPGKLQAQYEVLSSDPAATVCFTRAHGIDADGTPREETWPQPDQVGLSSEDLLRRNFIQTCSVMFRRGVVPEVPAWFDGLEAADWPMSILHALRGTTRHVDIDAAAYRFHGGGIWSGRDHPRRALASERALRVLCDHTDLEPEQRSGLRRARGELLRSAAVTAARAGQPGDLWRALRAVPALGRRGSTV